MREDQKTTCTIPSLHVREFTKLIYNKVDHHWGRVFAVAGLASLLGIGTELAVDSDDQIANAVRDRIQDTANQAGQHIVDRNLNIQPTLKVRPGWPLRVIVTRDLPLRPYEKRSILMSLRLG